MWVSSPNLVPALTRSMTGLIMDLAGTQCTQLWMKINLDEEIVVYWMICAPTPSGVMTGSK